MYSKYQRYKNNKMLHQQHQQQQQQNNCRVRQTVGTFQIVDANGAADALNMTHQPSHTDVFVCMRIATRYTMWCLTSWLYVFVGAGPTFMYNNNANNSHICMCGAHTHFHSHVVCMLIRHHLMHATAVSSVNFAISLHSTCLLSNCKRHFSARWRHCCRWRRNTVRTTVSYTCL